MSTLKLFQPTSLNDLRLSKEEHLVAHPSHTCSLIRTNISVLDISDPSEPRTLILQRADRNGLAGKWESPGGKIEDDDCCILDAVARQLQDQTGLKEVTKHLKIDMSFAFTSGKRTQMCQLNLILLLTKKPTVKLNKAEHKGFEWVTGDRMSAMHDGSKLTRKEVFLAAVLAFRRTPPKNNVDEGGQN